MEMPAFVNNKNNLEFNQEFSESYDLLQNSNKHIFITGKAGTGKSTLLDYFRNNTNKNVIVLAPTGVAAVNVKGQTIHSFFRFKPDITPDKIDTIYIRREDRVIYRKIDTIIIDEISMVRADIMDCIDAFLRMHGRHSELEFGGVQMVFIGDLFQLPPVVTNRDMKLFNGFYKSPYFFDSKIFDKLEFEYIELKKVYRQQDENFIQLLNDIRNNSISQEDLELFNKRFNPTFSPKGDDFYIYLTTTNEKADIVNSQRLAQLDEKLIEIEGEVNGKFQDRDLPTQEKLMIKAGAQVMLLNNDPQGRWVNGTVGHVVTIRVDTLRDNFIKVELENGEMVEVTPHKWEMFRFFYNDEDSVIESESVGSFSQFPLRLAWAITIHKSQGKTFKNVIIDVGSGTFAHGQLYVALSRCTDLSGIILKRQLEKKHIIVDKIVINGLKLLKSAYKRKKND